MYANQSVFVLSIVQSAFIQYILKSAELLVDNNDNVLL